MDSITSAISQFLSTVLSFITTGVLLAALAVIAWIVYKKIQFRKELDQSHNYIYLLVKIPLTNEQKESAMDELLKSLHRILPNNTPLSLEMVSNDQFLRFYIVTKNQVASILQSQIYAQYPEAEIEETKDYLDTIEDVVFTEIHFKRASLLPIKTYQSFDDSFLKNLSALLSKTDPGDRVYVQLVLKRISSKFWERGFKALQFNLFGTKYAGENPTPQYWKLSQDLFKGKLRIGYKSSGKFNAQLKLDRLVGLFKMVKGTNELKKKRFTLARDINKAYRARVFENGDLWTTSEIATLYHFPFGGSSSSNVVHTTSKRAPSPELLPRMGQVDPRAVSFFGETNYRNDRKIFGIKRFDRRRHIYVVGKTGSGKSRLLQLLMLSDIRAGHGCCLIDPHGDLVNELLMFIPKERIKDVVYINPLDIAYPIGFNPLEPVEDFQMRQHLATFFISIFKKQFAASWNQRMEHLFRYITLALLETPDSNIMGIPRILADTSYRQKVIMQIQDPVVRSFWINEFSSWNENYANDAIIPIINKVGQFVANPTIRNMVGQQKNVLDFEKFMNEGNIVLINLSKGRLGDDNAALLGSMFITKIQQAALSRAGIPEEQRRDFYFYVDEFQNFATDAFATILSEARKYRLNLTIAHQYIAQLPQEVKATAFGNVGSIITFAIGADDAAYLAKEFSPTFAPDDMINLSMREMYVKMSIDGKLATPFSAKTINVPQPEFDYSVEIINSSRSQYGKNRQEVEQEIVQWAQMSSATTQAKPVDQDFPEPII